METPPWERTPEDPLRAQWDKVGDLRMTLARDYRIFLSGPQRLACGLLAVAYTFEDGENRIQTLGEAEKLLAKAQEVEENSALLAELTEAIMTLKELEARALEHEVSAPS